jgi:undecaprenyl-diphosphatase
MFFGVIEDVLSGDPLVAIDKAVYHALQELRTPIGDTFMIALTELGDAAVTLPVVIAVLLWLLWKRAWRPVAYWIAAAGFGAALTVILKAGFGLPRPLPLYDGSVAFGFPSGHAAMSMVVFGFLAVLCARELGLRGKLAVFSVAALIAGLIAFSRLYLGAHWLSDVLGGLSFGLAWIAMLGMAYARRPAPAIAARGLLLVAGLAFVTGAVVHGENQRAADRTRYAPQFTLTLMPEADWWHAAWETLPAWRIDIKGENEQPLTFQWAGALKPLRAELAAHGWREAPPTSAGTLLYWLDSRRPAMQLPLLPHAHNGHHEALALIRPVDGSLDRRLVLRLWPTARALAPDRTPLWVGTVAEEILSRPLHGFNLPRDSADFNTPLHILRADLVGVTTRRVIRNNASLPEDDDENRDIVWDRSVLLAFQAGMKK